MSTEHPTPPGRPSIRALLWVRPSTRGRWAPAVRAGLAFMIPAMVLLGCGLDRNAILAALGSFAVLFGERRPYRIRWKAIGTAGLLLIITATMFGLLGAWVGPSISIPRELVTVAALTALTAVSVFGVNALRLGPPGPFFLILVGGVAVIAARHGTSPWILALATAAGAASSLAVSMAPALWRPHGPEVAATEAALAASDQFLATNREPARRHGVASSTLNAWSVLHDAAATDSDLARRLWETHHRVHGAESGPTMTAPLPRPSILRRVRMAARPDSQATVTAVRATATVAAAGAVSVFAGLGRPDWAIVSAVLVLQMGPDRIRGSVRGSHRILGTFTGLAIFALLHALDLPTVALVVVLVVLNMMIELTVTTNYALAVTFITPLALLMGAPSQPLADQMLSRVLETVVGVGFAIAALWLVLPRMHRSTLRSADAAARTADDRVLSLAQTRPVSSGAMRVARRDLQWQLLESEMAATDSANDEPSWTREYWPTHAAIRSVGYDTLSACWQAGPDERMPESVRSHLIERASQADRPTP